MFLVGLAMTDLLVIIVSLIALVVSIHAIVKCLIDNRKKDI